MDFGGGDFCVFSDVSCGFGSNPERKDWSLRGTC
jgi:hypothetical protein